MSWLDAVTFHFLSSISNYRLNIDKISNDKRTTKRATDRLKESVFVSHFVKDLILSLTQVNGLFLEWLNFAVASGALAKEGNGEEAGSAD